MEFCRIEWSTLYSVDTAQTKRQAQNKGVYAIYEMSGRTPKKLLYIGETYSQTFATRLKQHKKEWFHTIDGKMSISFGKIYPFEGKRLTERQILDIESYLIHFYIPPCNTKGKKRYAGRQIAIISLGERALLKKIVTSNNEVLTLIKKYFYPTDSSSW